MAKKKPIKNAKGKNWNVVPSAQPHQVVVNEYYVRRDAEGPQPEEPAKPLRSLEEVLTEHVQAGQKT